MPFSRPTLSDLINRTLASIRSRLTNEQMRRSDAQVYAREMAGTSHELHGHLQFLAQNIIYDTADTEYLDRYASIYLTQPRIDAVAALGFVTFTGTDGSIIPSGSPLVRADGVEYETDADVTIASGIALAAVTALLPGAAGNAIAGTVLSLSTPIAGVASNASVDSNALTSGSDQEDDTSLRSRLLERIRKPPQGGAAYDYVAWAKEIGGVTRVWVYPHELEDGGVTVRFVRDNDANIIPDPAEVTVVQDHLDSLRPVTAKLVVVAPIADPIAFSIQLFPSTTEVRAAVAAELRDLISRESEPDGILLLSHIREAISIAAGEENYVMTVPSADINSAAGHMATMGVITWL